jgi:hypothetical protein
MNVKLLWSSLIVALALPAQAGEPQQNTTVASPAAAEWTPDSRLWQNLLTGRSDSPSSLRLGKSEFTLGGPIIQSFRPRPRSTDRNLGQKILDFPVISWFVPQRMPVPPGGTGPSYFAWGERHRSWADVAAGSPAGSSFSAGDTQAQSGLISFQW